MEKAKRKPLHRTIDEQYGAAWAMLEEAIGRFPPDQWRVAEDDHLVPARLAYHVIETIDYYLRDDLDSFPWGKRFGADWDTASPEELPAREQIVEYLADVKSQGSRWIKSLGDVGLTAPDAVFHAEGYAHLDRALYALRHTHQHLGELHGELRKRGLPRPPWR